MKTQTLYLLAGAALLYYLWQKNQTPAVAPAVVPTGGTLTSFLNTPLQPMTTGTIFQAQVQ